MTLGNRAAMILMWCMPAPLRAVLGAKSVRSMGVAAVLLTLWLRLRLTLDYWSSERLQVGKKSKKAFPSGEPLEKSSMPVSSPEE